MSQLLIIVYTLGACPLPVAHFTADQEEEAKRVLALYQQSSDQPDAYTLQRESLNARVGALIATRYEYTTVSAAGRASKFLDQLAKDNVLLVMSRATAEVVVETPPLLGEHRHSEENFSVWGFDAAAVKARLLALVPLQYGLKIVEPPTIMTYIHDTFKILECWREPRPLEK